MIKKAPLGAEPMMCEAISCLCLEEPWFCWARAHSYCGKSVFLQQSSKGPKGDDVPSPHAYRSVSFGGSPEDTEVNVSKGQTAEKAHSGKMTIMTIAYLTIALVQELT